MKDELSGRGVRLRRYGPDDTPLIYQAVRESLGEISPWMSWCSADYSVEQSRAWVSSRDEAWGKGAEYSFVITEAEGDTLLGAVGLNYINRNHGFANLGYWVRSSRTGRGVATAATRLAARFGVRNLGLRRIEIVAAVGNGASRRVAEKSGAKEEGVLRNRLIVHGVSHDAVMYSLIPTDPSL